MIGRYLRSRHHSYVHSVQANGQNDRCNTVSMPREPTRSPPTGGVLACHSKRLNSAAVLSPQTSSRPFELWDPGSRLRTDPRREAGPSESHGYTFNLIPVFRDLVGGGSCPERTNVVRSCGILICRHTKGHPRMEWGPGQRRGSPRHIRTEPRK